MGLRELKKQKTRKAISDMATQLFIERGFHDVTTAEIAKACDVSLPTLFNYFPTKEALVFDEDLEQEKQLVDMVLKRKKGQSILAALLEGGCTELDLIIGDNKKVYHKFMELIERTPELNTYAQKMWARHEITLGAAIRKEAKSKMSKLEADAIARFVLDSFYRALGSSQPKATLRTLFKILESGWRE